MVKKLLVTVVRYKHLFNPMATSILDAKDVNSAPTGSLKLSDDPKKNLALWNTAFMWTGILPIAYLINTLANKYHESKVEDELDKAMVTKLNAMRPRVVADPNLGDTSTYTDLPKKELKQLEEIKTLLSKNASEEDDSSTLLNSVNSTIKDTIKDIGYNLMPIAITPVAALVAVGLSNHLNRRRIKKNLAERKVQLENIQAKLDRRQLQDAGLIKRDPNKDSVSDLVKTAAAPMPTKDPKTNNRLKSVFLDFPLLMHAVVASALGIGAYNLFRSKDKNLATLKYLKKTHLGANTLQDTPKIGVLDLPVDPEDILAVPGDSKQETIIHKENEKDSDSDNKSNKSEDKKLENKSGNRSLLENKEVFEEITPKRSGISKNREKDAIF